MKTALLLLAGLLTSCSTTIYEGGQKVVRIQSDARGISYKRTPDGAVTLTADILSNSTPVLAVGKALTPVVTVLGTAVAAAATTNIIDAVRKPVAP